MNDPACRPDDATAPPERFVASRPPLFGGLTLRQLELLAMVAPMAFLGAVYLLILGPVHPAFHSWPGFVLLAAVLVCAMWAFTRAVFGAVRALQGEVESLSAQTERHNRQLMLLHGADLALMRETQAGDALERIPGLAVRLLAACHVMVETVPVPGSGGVAPITAPDLGERHSPRCSIESALRGDHEMRRPDADARLLVVPIAHLGNPIATLFVARSGNEDPFTDVDREVARMFATHAALVLENDRLYDEVRALAIEAERQALAREMHDGLAQVLAYVNAKAQAVALYLERGEVAAARDEMTELSAAAREVYADIRQGIGAMRVQVSGKGLRTMLEEYARDVHEASGLSVQVHWTDVAVGDGLSPEAEVQVFRIVQEALANVRRHAGARAVSVTVAAQAGELLLSVDDDGRGFDPELPGEDGRPRFGLRTMAERAASLGGQLEVESALDRGTRIRLRIPLAARGRRAG